MQREQIEIPAIYFSPRKESTLIFLRFNILFPPKQEIVESPVITVAPFLDVLIVEFGLSLVDISFESGQGDALKGGKK